MRETYYRWKMGGGERAEYSDREEKLGTIKAGSKMLKRTMENDPAVTVALW